MIPAIQNERGVAPFPRETANPSTAKIPPPTIPPIPIEIASLRFIFLFEFIFFMFLELLNTIKKKRNVKDMCNF